MKKKNTKVFLVITIMVASFSVAPMMVAGYDYDNDDYNLDQMGISGPEDLMHIFGGLGSMFGRIGYGGKILGRVFEMLLMDEILTDFSQNEVMPGVYVISAFSEEHYNGTRHFGNGTIEHYLPHYGYNQRYRMPGSLAAQLYLQLEQLPHGAHQQLRVRPVLYPVDVDRPASGGVRGGGCAI